jgi:HSP20 family protein
MAKDNRSFFEKLTGAIKMDPQDSFDDDITYDREESRMPAPRGQSPQRRSIPVAQSRNVEPESTSWIEEEPEDGELTVDVYQTSSEIVIKTMVAGVRPEDLDITITRDMVTIKGKRETEKTVSDDDYFHQELYWGTFSRTIMLPAEVEVEEADAVEKHGLLIIRLPKIDKNKQARLKVKG